MGIELSPRINDHGFRKKRESSCLAFLDVWILFGCILLSVPPLYLPINQPLAYCANRPRAIFQRPIVPLVPRKRQEEHNKGEKKAHVLRVRVLLLLLLLLLFVHAGVCCVASVDVQSLVQFLSSESLPLRLQQSEFRGGQSPNHLPISHRHPRHVGGVCL